MVSFELFCRPALRQRMGMLEPLRPKVQVTLTHTIKKRIGRRDYQRCRLQFREGSWHAEVTGPQGSGIMISMAEAQALLELAEDRDVFEAGEKVPALLLDESLEGRTS
jgi:molybdopterin molybdotransferase